MKLSTFVAIAGVGVGAGMDMSWEGMWLGSFWGFLDVGLLSFSTSIFSL